MPLILKKPKSYYLEYPHNQITVKVEYYKKKFSFRLNVFKNLTEHAARNTLDEHAARNTL